MPKHYLDLEGLQRFKSSLYSDVNTKQQFSLIMNAFPLTYKTGSTTSGSEKTVRWYCSGVSNGISTITQPYDGMKIMVKIPRVGLTTVGVALSINGNISSEYHPVVYNVNTVLTSQFPVNSFKILVYNATATMTAYITTAGTVETITGVWQCESDYDSNTDTKVRQYQYNEAATALSGTKYSILTRYNQTDKASSYDATYSRFNTNTYIDVSTGYLYAPKLYSDNKEVAVKDDLNNKYTKPSTGIPASDLEQTYVVANTAITSATKCKITYDSKGLVTAGADLAASDIPSLAISKITDLQSTLNNKADKITVTEQSTSGIMMITHNNQGIITSSSIVDIVTNEDIDALFN